MNILTKNEKDLIRVGVVSIFMCALSTVSLKSSTETINTMTPKVEVEISVEADGPYAGISNELESSLEKASVSEHDVETVESAAPEEEVVEEVMAPIYPIINREAFSATKYVAASFLNIRTEPNENSDVIKIIRMGDPVNITEQVHIQLNEAETAEWVAIEGGGYINSKYLQDDSPIEFIGDYIITYYCPCERCCAIANRPTASQVMPEQGVTIAADPSIPFGTKLMIDGQIYTVQDRGGKIKGNHIDVFVNTHWEAKQKGQHLSKVYLVY